MIRSTVTRLASLLSIASRPTAHRQRRRAVPGMGSTPKRERSLTCGGSYVCVPDRWPAVPMPVPCPRAGRRRIHRDIEGALRFPKLTSVIRRGTWRDTRETGTAVSAAVPVARTNARPSPDRPLEQPCTTELDARNRITRYRMIAHFARARKRYETLHQPFGSPRPARTMHRRNVRSAERS